MITYKYGEFKMSNTAPLSKVPAVEVSKEVKNSIIKLIEQRHCVVLTTCDHKPLLQISLREAVCTQMIDYIELQKCDIAEVFHKYLYKTEPGKGHRFMYSGMLVCHIKNVTKT